MRIGVCSGSFDPVTSGHLNIFERAAKLFDTLIIAVFCNPNKKPLFTMEERVEMLREATAHIPNIRIDAFSGLLADYVREQGACAIVRGLRTSTDFEYEMQHDLFMQHAASDIETVYLMAGGQYSFVSSSGIKEMAKFHGPIKGLVPANVEQRIIEKYKND
ncbi:MAG: pantetheine-phosphate adenylyltransferase [Selenomonadales bacterium]|nr:pantetheine-phosphate adenylyltransferase [Selenomonadales bacterium]